MIFVVVGYLHGQVSSLLVSMAYALGDASRAVPPWLKTSMIIAGFPLTWFAYFLRFVQGTWSATAAISLFVLTPLNSLFVASLVTMLFSRWYAHRYSTSFA